MSSITNAEAADFSVSQIPERYILDQRPTSQLFSVLPFLAVPGHELLINLFESGVLSADMPPGLKLKDYAGTSDGADPLDAVMPSVKAFTFPIKRLSAELHVDGIISGLYGSVNDITHELIRVKVEAVRDHFKALMIRGDPATNPDEFAGLSFLTSILGGNPMADITLGKGMGFAANANAGGTVQAGEIERLLGLLNPRANPGSSFLVMHAKAYEHLRRNNYADVEFVVDPEFGPMPMIAGITILIDNFIPTDETYAALNNLTSIYAATVGEGVGLCGIYPAANDGNEIQVRGPYVKEARDRKYYHVTWDVGLACFNTGALTRLSAVQYGN